MEQKRPIFVGFSITVLVLVVASLIGIVVTTTGPDGSTLESITITGESVNNLGIAICILLLGYPVFLSVIWTTLNNIDSPLWVAKRFWKLLGNPTPADEYFLNTLPRRNCFSTIMELIRESQNGKLEIIYEQYKLDKSTITECAFQAVSSLNLGHLRFLFDGAKVVSADGSISESHKYLAHKLARGYERQGSNPDFMVAALYLRSKGMDFGEPDTSGQRPIDEINSAKKSPVDPQTTMKILEIFDPEKSNEEIVEKYASLLEEADPFKKITDEDMQLQAD